LVSVAFAENQQNEHCSPTISSEKTAIFYNLFTLYFAFNYFLSIRNFEGQN